MQPIGTFTKIHGKGNIALVVDGVLDKELMRQREAEQKAFENERAFLLQKLHETNEQHRLEMRCQQIFMNGYKDKCDQNRKKGFDALEVSLHAKAKKHILNFVENIYAFCYACIVVYAEMLKNMDWTLIEYVGDEDEEEE